jgi:structural maintenance of chromosomes protein 6
VRSSQICCTGGKSAVLSALTVALGGKATSTGRGNGLKAFIREGQPYVSFSLTSLPVVTSCIEVSAAEVTINLKNQGEEAYKPDLYGDSIVITRRFSKEGASSYKIKSKDGRLISTKREELSAICDHMNIQVDNPMNVLTQGI